ncbi:DsrE family protein [Parvularcula sp. ZS-1/3]|uniref:DsrE family protein n=1 Tax=Parvularcula mediterranea TaxID=2732508 RepID=A0A7Y3RMV1_9PROT|nr:DsrE family protein [Parvularcula mediterranea]NNU16496.1 DsrE family protein [Parvularcula mediterranea]
MRSIISALAFLSASAAAQDLPGFEPGNVLPEFGKVADVETSFEAPQGQPFRVVFDVAKTVEEGESPHIGKAARFLNMHGEGGVDPRPLDIVVVIHGRAVGDITNEDRNEQRAMVEALLGKGVRFIVCGQSLAGLQVPQSALIEGVEVALSAMTAHASLMEEGYHSMPF